MMARSLRELREEVYDSSSHLDENCSLIDEDYWYENDLVLAAELGKTLLERNRHLEGQLVQSQKNTGDQQLEIDLLTKQLATLRELSENKMKIYEDVDKQCQELEKANKRLVNDNKMEKQRLQSLYDQVSMLEMRNEELLNQTERLRKEKGARERQNRQERRLRKTTSVPSVHDALHLENWPRSPLTRRRSDMYGGDSDVDEVVRLHDKICELNFQVSSERRKKESLESELRMQVHELEDLRATVDALRSELLSLQTRLQHDADIPQCSVCSRRLADTTAPVVNPDEKASEITAVDASAMEPSVNDKPRNPADAVVRDLFSGVEHDIEAVADAEMGRLRTGGKVFSSRESLNRVGAEDAEKGAERGEISLLAELDQQYNKLVQQYESLISSKSETQQQQHPTPPNDDETTTPTSSHPPTPTSQQLRHRTSGAADSSPLSPTSSSTQFERKLNSIFSEETRRQRKTMTMPDYRPQYKQLFREAFSVLKDMKHRTRRDVPDS